VAANANAAAYEKQQRDRDWYNGTGGHDSTGWYNYEANGGCDHYGYNDGDYNECDDYSESRGYDYSYDAGWSRG
jgi:hypothetical protein